MHYLELRDNNAIIIVPINAFNFRLVVLVFFANESRFCVRHLTSRSSDQLNVSGLC